MKIDITQIAVALIALLSTVVTGFLVPWLKSKININKDKLTENQQYFIKLAINTAVKAAEQIFNSEEGQKKKEYVLNLLREQGFEVDTEAFDSAVEAAVLELHRELKPITESEAK